MAQLVFHHEDCNTSIRERGGDSDPCYRKHKDVTFIIILTKSHTASWGKKSRKPGNNYPTMTSKPFCASRYLKSRAFQTISQTLWASIITSPAIEPYDQVWGLCLFCMALGPLYIHEMGGKRLMTTMYHQCCQQSTDLIGSSISPSVSPINQIWDQISIKPIK